MDRLETGIPDLYSNRGDTFTFQYGQIRNFN